MTKPLIGRLSRGIVVKTSPASAAPSAALSSTTTTTIARHGDDKRLHAGYEAYVDELIKRHDEGRDYPIGDMLPCYTCNPVDGVLRTCVALGPVTNAADPTQTYKLECGHLTI